MPSGRRRHIDLLDEIELAPSDSNYRLLPQDSDEDASEEDYLLSPKKKILDSNPENSQASRLKMGLCDRLCSCFKKPPLTERSIPVGRSSASKYSNNLFINQKYSIFSFVPKVLYNQYKNFLDMFFLLMACSQFIPLLRIGIWYTYWAPLCFVTFVTMAREGYDDIQRYRRDKEVNSSQYFKLTPKGKVKVLSAEIKVGDLIYVEKGSRVPADMVLLRTTESTGSCFLRTDQLDGETDWKKRDAVHHTQTMSDFKSGIFKLDNAHLRAEAPCKEIHSFTGVMRIDSEDIPLSLENTMWANTVVASGTSLGLVIYTGPETRATMNNSKPRSKMGRIDKELNNMTKILLIITACLSVTLMCLRGVNIPWQNAVVTVFRFILLLSYLVPISLRVNMDLSKIYYCYVINTDRHIDGAISRSTTIPEELGRVSYLMSDKTGTLTLNEMIFKRLHLGSTNYSEENFHVVRQHLSAFFGSADAGWNTKKQATQVKKVGEAVKALALCHNVIPVLEESQSLDEETDPETEPKRVYQAASPDEVALAEWCESVRLTLMDRTNTMIKLQTPDGHELTYTILQVFPFTSERKRMGIIVKDDLTGEYIFYLKGADVVMAEKVVRNDWMAENVTDLAKEGFRTLVVAKKTMTQEQYAEFEKNYISARAQMDKRQVAANARIDALERDMELLCVTGVEDRLQEDVRATLLRLRKAGIRIWMLTGDKKETAICIAQSSGLFSRTERVFIFPPVTDRSGSHQALNDFRRKEDTVLVITGDDLKVVMKYDKKEFVELASSCPAVICCRCSPEQKADVVSAIMAHTKKLVAAIGDGGNDVSMIQAASVGIGIVGKEGQQASLAADFSITKFHHVAPLLLYHGRNSYKRTATLSQFIIHRGLIISTMQIVFSAVFGFIALPLYPSVLMVLYATIYTSCPVFSLVLDTDIKDEATVLNIPDLYKELLKGRSLSTKTFLIWTLVSVYQGGVIMLGALLLFEDDFYHIVSISFSALILTELLMVALTVRHWHILMIVAEISSLCCYVISILYFTDVFDPSFIWSVVFLWKFLVLTAVSCLPLFFFKLFRRRFSPSTYQKIA